MAREHEFRVTQDRSGGVSWSRLSEKNRGGEGNQMKEKGGKEKNPPGPTFSKSVKKAEVS